MWERAEPHAWLDQIRSEDPVHWHEESDGPGFWAHPPLRLRRRRRREDPGAVEEILRWESPIHHFRRTATRDVEVGGQMVAEGDKVIMWYAGANRDPLVFDDPHRFDIGRTPNPQQSFGIGEHFCLGANLARLSLRLVFEALLTNVRDIELAARPRRLHSDLINGVKEMQVTYRMR